MANIWTTMNTLLHIFTLVLRTQQALHMTFPMPILHLLKRAWIDVFVSRDRSVSWHLMIICVIHHSSEVVVGPKQNCLV